jgi:GDPmannose 4,6-dehydratase
MFAVSGILFNHESPLRGEEFITRKISLGLSKVIYGNQKVLKLGNIYAKRDWGYAKDYVEAMWKMLQIKKPQDFVIATGKTYSVKDFINKCVKILGLKTKWVGKGLNERLIDLKNNRPIIVIDKKFFRPTEVNILRGDYSKAKKILKWKPKTGIDELARLMIESDMKYSNKN